NDRGNGSGVNRKLQADSYDKPSGTGQSVAHSMHDIVNLCRQKKSNAIDDEIDRRCHGSVDLFRTESRGKRRDTPPTLVTLAFGQSYNQGKQSGDLDPIQVTPTAPNLDPCNIFLGNVFLVPAIVQNGATRLKRQLPARVRFSVRCTYLEPAMRWRVRKWP